MSDIKEQIEAIKTELEAAEEKKVNAFAELGELALPELKDNKAFAEPVAKLEEIISEIKALNDREAELVIEQEKFDKEEKERLLKCTCIVCKTVNPEDAKFCENCGNKVGEIPREYCEACGFMNPPGLKFCGECGAKLKDAE